MFLVTCFRHLSDTRSFGRQISYLCSCLYYNSILVMLVIRYKGQERSYPVRREVSAYTLRYTVDIDGVKVIFESDEEGHYRAFIPKNPPPIRYCQPKNCWV